MVGSTAGSLKWFPASATFPYQLTFDDDEVLGALLTSESYVEGICNTCNESSWCVTVLARFVVPSAAAGS